MPSPRLLFLSLVVGVICATALAACGSDEEGTIPPANAEALLAALDDAQGERELQDCQGIADAAGNLLTAIEGLPDSVDSEVETALTQGAQNLQDLAQDPTKCETGPTGAEGPQDEDTTTDTTDEFTETTTTTSTTETEEEPPPEQPGNEGGGGQGQGNEGGQPPGGGPPANPPGQGTPPTGGTGGEDDD